MMRIFIRNFLFLAVGGVLLMTSARPVYAIELCADTFNPPGSSLCRKDDYAIAYLSSQPGRDGVLQIQWNITNHDDCPFNGPQLTCLLQSSDGDSIQRVEGDWPIKLDHIPEYLTQICQCGAFPL
jgi:hypothetical protein